jgi:hypothetical protein
MSKTGMLHPLTFLEPSPDSRRLAGVPLLRPNGL